MAEVGGQPLSLGSLPFRRTAIAAAVATDRLLLLDDVWTAYCDSKARGEPYASGPDIDGIVNDMRAQLKAVRQYAADLYPVFQALDESVFERALYEALRPYPEGERLVGVLRENTYPAGIQGTLLAATEDIIEFAPSESELIQEKLAAMTRGEASAGDLRIRRRCALYIFKIACLVGGAGVLAIAAGIAVPLVAVGTGLVIAGTTADAILGWRDSECAKHGPQVAMT